MTVPDGYIPCPACSELCEVPIEAAPAAICWRNTRVEEVRCQSCGWLFGVTPSGELLDDGGLDTAPPFDLDEQGELTDDELVTVFCERCSRPFEIGELGAARCPHCRHTRWLDPHPAETMREYPGDEIENEYEDYDPEESCPSCYRSGQDQEDGEMTPLSGGWVLCESCQAPFHSPALNRELLEIEREMTAGVVPFRGFVAPQKGDLPALNNAICTGGRKQEMRLTAGLYRGSDLKGGKEFRLSGEGPIEQVRFVQKVKLNGARVRLEGITFEDGLEFFCCNLEMRNCVIRGDGLTVHGSLGKVRLRNCMIEKSGTAGVFLAEGASARLYQCQIQGNQREGVSLHPEAWVRMVGCHVERNGALGVNASGLASAFLHDCQVRGNQGGGVHLERGRALFRRCEIAQNDGLGLAVGEKCRAYLRHCQIADNHGSGLALGRQARLLLRDSQIERNQGMGIVAQERTRLVAQRCRIIGNAVGVQLAAGARLTLSEMSCQANATEWQVEPGACIRSTPTR